MKSNTRFLTIAAFAMTLPAWAGSTVSSYSGDIGFINTPPGSLVPGADENDLKALLFMEDTNLVFSSAITVDATAPGLYQSKASLTPGSVAAGTLVSDAYIHTDPVTSGTTFTGSVTFSSDILGVIATSSDLVATDPLLGVSSTTYGTIHDAPGLELSPSQDYFSISADLRTLTFSVKTWNFTDDLRVITEGSLTASTGAQSAVPEPGTIPLIALGLGLIAIGVRARKRQSPR